MTLRIGWLSTWNTRCGISEYSRDMVRALRRADPDIEVTVLGSINHGRWAVRENEDFVTPVFLVGSWAESSWTLDVDEILRHDFDVLHVQYNVDYFPGREFNRLIAEFSGVLAVTFHEDAVPDGFDDSAFALRYAARAGVGLGDVAVLPLGAANVSPVIKTFGLGRSRADLIGEVCRRNDWVFESSFGSDGGQWMEAEELYSWLRDSDAIVLWYDEYLAAGASSALRVAASTRRLVVCNATSWFTEVPRQDNTIRKVADLAEMERVLRDHFATEMLERDSWERLSARLISDYRAALGQAQALDSGVAFSWEDTGLPREGDLLTVEQCLVRMRPALRWPTALAPGSSGTLPLLVENVSDVLLERRWLKIRATWSWLDSDGGQCGEEQETDLPVSLAPGERANMSVPVQVPAAATGGALATFALVQVDGLDFSDHESVDSDGETLNVLRATFYLGASGGAPAVAYGPLPLSGCEVILDATIPLAMTPGEHANVAVSIHNRGGAPLAEWPPNPVQIGVVWTDVATGQRVEGKRVLLHDPIGTGEARYLACPLTAPGTPGLWRVMIGLVQEHVRWFSQVAPQSAHEQTVGVRGADPYK